MTLKGQEKAADQVEEDIECDQKDAEPVGLSLMGADEETDVLQADRYLSEAD